jgi:hypothetical protein
MMSLSSAIGKPKCFIGTTLARQNSFASGTAKMMIVQYLKCPDGADLHTRWSCQSAKNSQRLLALERP